MDCGVDCAAGWTWGCASGVGDAAGSARGSGAASKAILYDGRNARSSDSQDTGAARGLGLGSALGDFCRGDFSRGEVRDAGARGADAGRPLPAPIAPLQRPRPDAACGGRR